MIQILTHKFADYSTIKVEITVKLINLVQHPLSLAPPNITAHFLPPSFKTTEFIYKYDRYTKKDTWIQHSIILIQDYHTHVFFKNNFSSRPFSFYSFRAKK